ncbi:uncharacterized protein UV8b_01778 [Ustilaginoidea virens]|uniref:Uncharacterized protein n=1 Tax=Ustilaginoidea virens TaxID=1159556 RepID=A0A8E5MF95_USTVR|nr:uncharacterized protein UV8b_01778 [Ustilaginoidea virens]QUC17537.1 hypothetical protein UV8b_01778 [Ustilaginoidea virens]
MIIRAPWRAILPGADSPASSQYKGKVDAALERAQAAAGFTAFGMGHKRQEHHPVTRQPKMLRQAFGSPDRGYQLDLTFVNCLASPQLQRQARPTLLSMWRQKMMESLKLRNRGGVRLNRIRRGYCTNGRG